MATTASRDRTEPRTAWLLLGAIVLAALGLRLYGLGDVHLWFDETLLFNHNVYGDSPQSALEFARELESDSTYAVGWPLAIWGVSRALGGSVFVARLLPALLGTAGVLAVLVLAMRVVGRFGAGVAVLVAGGLAAASITQIEFAQRIYPYCAVPFFAALTILLHLEIAAALDDDASPLPRFALACAGYAAVAAIGLTIHASLVMLFAVSFPILGLTGLWRARTLSRSELRSLLGVAVLTALVLALAVLMNAKDPREGYRGYLAPYYHGLGVGLVPFFVSRTYDVLTYNLNLFFDTALYWPRSWNPVLIPLVAACGLGWLTAALGRFGRTGRHLALLAAAGMALPAFLSVPHRYPFGGVRQSLFLSPFLLVFTGLGVDHLRRSRFGQAAVVALGLGYLVLWGIHLPAFYAQRATPVSANEIVALWQEHGRYGFQADGGCGDALRYLLREHPEIDVDGIGEELPREPFFIVSMHWPIEESLWQPALASKLTASGRDVERILFVPPAVAVDPDYRQSIYHPPNGFWVYKVGAASLAPR